MMTADKYDRIANSPDESATQARMAAKIRLGELTKQLSGLRRRHKQLRDHDAEARVVSEIAAVKGRLSR